MPDEIEVTMSDNDGGGGLNSLNSGLISWLIAGLTPLPENQVSARNALK